MDTSYDPQRGMHHNHIDLAQALTDLAKSAQEYLTKHPPLTPFEQHALIDMEALHHYSDARR